jgi:organic hydroperoxide reductase OsmC/OhrA
VNWTPPPEDLYNLTIPSLIGYGAWQMSEYKAIIRWKCSGPDFLKGRYSREHTWTFDGGFVVPASSSPSVVPVPMSNPANVDPEEAFVAAVSSCHMLTFIYLAGKAQFQVDSYEDEAVGVMSKNEKGVPWISAITLHPKIAWGGGNQPTATELAALHHQAHEQCFIAASIKTQVSVSP